MTNLSKLRGKMAEKGMTVAAMAKVIGTTPVTFSRKLNGKRDFMVREMVMIQKALDITPEDQHHIEQQRAAHRPD